MKITLFLDKIVKNYKGKKVKLFYILVVIVFGFHACGELDDEFPTITLNGDKEITLRIDTFINEPGFSASDPQDGDLTKDVNISTNLDYSRVGEYEVKYSVKDTDGNIARQSRKIIIISDGLNSGDYVDYISDSSLYYLPSYLYDYRTLIGGTTVNQTLYTYDISGNRLELEDKSLTYEKDNESIYVSISGEDTKYNIITLDEIKSYNEDDNLISRFPVKMRINNDYIDDDMSCHISEYIDNFTTQEKTDLLSDSRKYFYQNVLNIECIKNGIKESIYYARGIGEVLRITDEKIFMQIR